MTIFFVVLALQFVIKLRFPRNESRSTLKRIANRSKRDEDVRKYEDQRNVVVKLNVKAKQQHFMSIQSKIIDNEKKFWKTVKPLMKITPVSW